MEKERKQFSMSLLVRILLGILIVVSLGIFANSTMRYNELQKEERELEEVLNNLIEARQDLEEAMGSSKEVEKLLSDYEYYRSVLESGTPTGETLMDLEEQLERLRSLLQTSKYKDYISNVARERLGLYFPDEEIIYHGYNTAD